MTDDSLAFDEKLELRSWGLPDYILQKYLNKGVAKMFPWQVECLMSKNVLLGGNLIYSAPTSAGKTLVSEILALKTVLERKKKVIIILPFVSVVREKMLYFQEVLCGSGIKVEGFMGSYNPPGGFKNVHLAVCTIEKANNIINRMLEDKNFDDIGCIVVDELHLLGDPHRGYLLELLLTKLKYVCQKGMAQSIQIVGMSATLPNLDLLAKWLNATLYHTQFRPIPLFEYLKVGRTIYKSPELTESFELETQCEIPNDPGDVVSLCLDTITQGFSVLVFCPAKNWCETLAVQIASEIKRLGNERDKIGQDLRTQLNSRGIYDTLEQLKKCPAGLEKNLSKSVSFGVAYHHAGLTLDERDIIEGGFRQSIIRVLVATSTLSSGVNLPARRVIVRSPAFQGQCMDILTYKQMIGRAGRMGKDTAGESFLICTEKDLNWGKQLVTSELPPVESCLGYGDLSISLKRALLEVIAGGVVTTSSEVIDYVMCTLLAASVEDSGEVSSAVEKCVDYLKRNEFIKTEEDGGVFPSSLAEACLSSSVPPDQALHLLKELHKARQCFVLDSDLHAIYQVTPYSICDSWNVDWMRVFGIWEELPANMQKIGDLIGVEDRFLIRAMRGTINLNAEEYAGKISVHKRFYTCLALQDLINEMPLNDVAAKYGCTKGMLQSLQQSASTFAAMVTSFCRKLGWGGLEVLLSELATRIQFGVQKELLDLLRLDSMTSVMARALFNAEITSLSELASSNLHAVQIAVGKAKPFKSENVQSNNSQEQKNTYLPGRPGLTEKEAASILIFEARRFLLKEMGVKTAEWEDSRIDLVNNSIYESTTLNHDEENSPPPPVSPQVSENKNLNPQLNENVARVDENNESSSSHVRPRKSSPVEFDLQVSGEKMCENVDDNLSDTVLVDENNLDISNIRRTNDPYEIANTFIPESQGKDNSNDESSEIIIDDSEDVKPPPCVTSSASDSMSFPIFVRNANLCSTYLIEGKDPTIDKLSMEVMKGSPDKSDMDFIDSVLDRIVAMKADSSTPIPVKTNELTNSSANDLFSDSINIETPDKTVLSTKKQNLEELDPNWGGDSLLELSQNFDSKIESFIKMAITPKSSGAKRKAPEGSYGNSPSNKRICTHMNSVFSSSKTDNLENKKNTMPDSPCSIFKQEPTEKNTELIYVTKNDIDPSFGDTQIEFDTQIENIINADIRSKNVDSPKFSKPKPLTQVNASPGNKSHLKMMSRPKSDGDLITKITSIRNGESFLAKAFDGSFKLSQYIQEVETPAEDLHISDSEDYINRSPDLLQKTKTDIKGSSTKKNCINTCLPVSSMYISPVKLSNSPKSSPSRRLSPSKYPPIGLNIVKHLKSPSRKKSLSFSNKSPGNSPKRKIKGVIINQPSSSSSSESPPAKALPPETLTLHLSKETASLKRSNSISLEKSNAVLSEKTPENSPEVQKALPEKFPAKAPPNPLKKPDEISSVNTQMVSEKTQISKARDAPPLTQNPSQRCKLSNLLLPLADKILNTQCFETQSNNREKEKTQVDKLIKSNLPERCGRILDVVALGETGGHVDALLKLKEFVFTIKTKKITDKETDKVKIGGRIVRSMAKPEIEPQFKVDDEALIGVYLYGGTVTYYFNMITLGTGHYRILKNVFIQRNIKLYGFNVKSQLKLFYKSCGYIISCRIFDLAVADWLLCPEEVSKTLEELASEYLKPNQRSPSKSENDVLSEVSLMWSLRSELTVRLQKANLLKHFEEIEMPIQLQVLFMEVTGVGLRHDLVSEMWTSCTELMGKLEMDAFSLANRKFSLMSNSDLNKVKKELKISLEEEADHPVVITIHDWRKLHSLKTRNLSQLLFIKEARCHSRNSTRTVTGRIVMTDPDLQHVPRDFNVGEELFSLRSAFIAGPGNILVSADYSQLELRILAHFSQDPVLVPVLRKGDDVFKNIAAEWNGISVDKVSDELRHQVKQMTYGIIYGMGDKALGEALGKTASDAAMLSARFKRSFPKLEEFVKRTIDECRQSGQVKTLAGRIRHLPGINSNNTNLRAQAERQAVNSKIQGSASDIAKKALIEIDNNLNRKFRGRSNLPSSLNTSHLILQLHDEFIYEVEESLADSFIPILRETMETATFLSVPLPVVVKWGKSWGLLRPV